MLALAAVPRPGIAQLAADNVLTRPQFDGLEERVTEFCDYIAELKREGKMLPIGDVVLPGAGDGWVYTGLEVAVLTPRCDSLMPLMQQMMKRVD